MLKMKRLIFTCTLLVLLSIVFFAQGRNYSTFYEQRATLFEVLPITSTDVVFLGNSITNGGEWAELFHDKRIKNRGISGDIAQGVYDRLDPILKGKPAKIFLMIGINDVAQGRSADSIASQIAQVVKKIKSDSPKTKLYLQSVLPVNNQFGKFEGHTSRGAVVLVLNERLKALAALEHLTYIDLFVPFVDPLTGRMKSELTNDGLHLLGSGYLLWRNILIPYVKGK